MMRSLSCVAAVVAVCGACQAQVFVFTADLSGPAEAPPNASPGIGTAQVDFDLTSHTMRVQATFSGLLAPTTASHIHGATATPFAGTAGVATQTPTFSGFPLGVTSGTYDHTFNTLDTATYNASFVTAHGGTAAGAEAFLLQSMIEGRTYLNIHTSQFPGGEIRGFLVPSPAAGAILGLGGLVASRRRRA